VLNTTKVIIQNCNISNFSGDGIYFYNSTGSALNNTIANSNSNSGINITNGSTVTCQYNVIYNTNHNQQGYGIQYNASSGTVGENDIDYFNWGITSILGSSITADLNPVSYNNRVTNCHYGIMVYYQSLCNLGVSTSSPTWGLNSIHDNNIYNAAVGYNYPTISSTLYAECDWWGSYPPNSSLFYVSSSCTGNFTYPISSDPWSGKPLPSIKKGNNLGENSVKVSRNSPTESNQNSNSTIGETNLAGQMSLSDSLLIGVEMLGLHKNKDAENFFMSYLNKHPNNQAAYVELYACADSETTPSIIQYFKTLPPQADKEHKLALSYLYLRQGNSILAKSVNDAIINSNSNTSLGLIAKLNNFYIALYNNNDPQRASVLINDLENKASLITPTKISNAEHALAYYVNPQTGVMPKLTIGQSANNFTTLTSLTKQSELMENYPNPFNPTTKINYQLSKNGYVSLKVYDILGREVASLVNENKQAGNYSIVFDASKLSSGIYIYTIHANDYVQSKKMIVMK